LKLLFSDLLVAFELLNSLGGGTHSHEHLLADVGVCAGENAVESQCRWVPFTVHSATNRSHRWLWRRSATSNELPPYVVFAI